MIEKCILENKQHEILKSQSTGKIMDCFSIGILKGLIEDNDPTIFFGSLLSFNEHIKKAQELKLVQIIDDEIYVTEYGKDFYEEYNIKSLPRTRAYLYQSKLTSLLKKGNFMKLKLIALFSALALLVGCGQLVEVPPASVGKIITKNGYQDGVIGTSKFRLEPCMMYCDKLAILQTADKAVTEDLEIFIPKDKLKMRVSVRSTLSIDPRKADELFNVIVPEGANEKVVTIPWDAVYKTYAQQIILINTREFLSKYSISEIASSMEEVNQTLGAMIQSELTKKTPFLVRNVGITSIKYPDIITAAQENAAKRREEIQQEEAQLQISQVKLERELQEARLQRQIDFEKAQGEAAAQKIQREVVDSRVLELRRLENERLWIEKWDGKLPVTALGESVPMVNLGSK